MDLDNAACAQLTIWNARRSTPRWCRRRPSQNASLPRASYFPRFSGHVGAARAARGGVLATFEKIDKREISWGARQGTVAHAGPKSYFPTARPKPKGRRLGARNQRLKKIKINKIEKNREITVLFYLTMQNIRFDPWGPNAPVFSCFYGRRRLLLSASRYGLSKVKAL